MEIYRELYQISKSLSEFTAKAKRLHKLMKEDWQEQFDELVRDSTSVVPRPKSEVRRRIQGLLDQQKQELLEKIKLEKKTSWNDDSTNWGALGYNAAIDDLEQLKQTL